MEVPEYFCKDCAGPLFGVKSTNARGEQITTPVKCCICKQLNFLVQMITEGPEEVITPGWETESTMEKYWALREKAPRKSVLHKEKIRKLLFCLAGMYYVQRKDF